MAKKDLFQESNPADAFLTAAGAADEPDLFAPREFKTVRKHLTLTPSIDNAIKKLAKKTGYSYNETAGKLLQAALEKWGKI